MRLNPSGTGHQATARPAAPALATPTTRRRTLAHVLAVAALVGDLLALLAAMVLAYWLRFRSGLIPVTKGEPLTLDAYLRAMLAVMVVWVLVFAWLDMYRPQRWQRALDEGYRVQIGAGAVLVVIMALSFLYRSFEYSRLTAAIAFGIVSLLDALVRGALVGVSHNLRRRPQWRARVAVLGALDVGQRLADEFRDVVFETATPQDELERVRGLLADGKVDEVLLSRSALKPDEVMALLRACEEAGAEAILVADPIDLLLRRGGQEDAAGYSLVRVRDVPLDGIQRALKRLADIVGAATLLVLLSPLLLLLAVLVKLTSEGPVLYRQERVTEGGRSFTMLKFRSMVQNAEQQTGAVWAKKGDARATPLGRFMRRTSLDELPQFWNVLVGDMSLIGPRPERPVFVEQFAAEVPRYRDRHRMKTGISGWAQVTGERGGESDIYERTRYDLFYIDNWSLLLDLQILVKTVFEVLFHRGAG